MLIIMETNRNPRRRRRPMRQAIDNDHDDDVDKTFARLISKPDK